jgi:hypothetical protein
MEMGNNTNGITIGMEQNLEDLQIWQGEGNCTTLKK